MIFSGKLVTKGYSKTVTRGHAFFGRRVTCSIGKLGQEGIYIDGLTIGFSIKKDLTPTENKAEIQIFNLSAAHRHFLESPGLKIILAAGYGENPKQIFYGDILPNRVTHSKEGASWLTSIHAADGHARTHSIKLSKSFKAGVTLSQAIEYAIGELTNASGYAKKKIDVPAFVYNKGLSLQGYAADVLDKLAKKHSLEWFSDDQQISVIQQDSDIGEAQVLLSAGTGLVGYPTHNEKGIQAESLVNGDIKIGKMVKLQSVSNPKLNGSYKVYEICHRGCSRGGDFNTKMEMNEKGRPDAAQTQ